MKKEFFALSMKWGEKAFAGMKDAQAQVLATDCPLAAIQIEQAIGVRPLNPIEFWRALRERRLCPTRAATRADVRPGVRP